MTNTFKQKHFTPNFTGKFGDKRLDERANDFCDRLSLTPCSSVKRLSNDKAEQNAFYRFLDNDSVKEEHFIEESSERVSKLSKGCHLLCFQDTCEINLSKHRGRIKANTGLGSSDKSDTAHCSKIHLSLVLDISTFNPIGFSDVKVYHRPEEAQIESKGNTKLNLLLRKSLTNAYILL